MRERAGAPGPFAEIAGARLRYEHTEAAAGGTPLVLIHGFSLDLRMWDDPHAALAGRVPVLRYDCRGFGESSLPRAGAPAGYAHGHDLDALLGSLGIDRADLIGFSMGAQIALEMAVEHPERVRKLILAGAWLADFRYSAKWKGVWSSIAEEGRRGDREAARRIWLTRGPFGPVLERPELGAHLRRMVGDYSGWHFVNLRHNPYLPVRDRLASIEAGTLVVIGERDWPDFHAVADLIAAKIRGTRVEVIPGTGHLVCMESSRRFTDLVSGFLDLPAARGES